MGEETRALGDPAGIGADHAARSVAFQNHGTHDARAGLIQHGAELKDFVGGAAIEHLELGFGEAFVRVQNPLAEGTQTVAGEVCVLQGNEVSELKVERLDQG